MMKKNTCKSIDHLLYLTDDELNNKEAGILTEHIASCESCRNIRAEVLTGRRLTISIKNNISEMPDFRLSAGYISELVHKAPHVTAIDRTGNLWLSTLTVIRYITSVAAVLLVILFASEQTISVTKIARLEHRVQSAASFTTSGIIDRITLARATFSNEEWKQLEIRLKSGHPHLNPTDLVRLRLLVDKRLLHVSGKDLANIIMNNPITFNYLTK